MHASYPDLEAARATWRYQPPPQCLAGRTIVITGAGDGIGRATAKACALYGANIVLLGKTRTKLEAVFDWIARHTETKPVIVPCDLALLDAASADALAESIAGEYGQLDGLLHAASALGPKVPVEHYPPEEWERVMRINAFAPFLLTRTLLPLLRQGGDASVVMLSSTVGRAGRAFWGAYSASKFALEGLTQILADEHDTEGAVRFASVNPGATRTAMRRAAYPGEDPETVPPPEAKLDLLIYLLSAAGANENGAILDARDWPGPSRD